LFGFCRGTTERPAVPAFPFLTLLVSGGHNMLVLSRAIGAHTIIGATLDDSIGESFDKTARLLGIAEIPGGPQLEKCSFPCAAHCATEARRSAHSLLWTSMEAVQVGARRRRQGVCAAEAAQQDARRCAAHGLRLLLRGAEERGE
jgi:tRNA A37 threonylcarbamoyltransferase TsaD